MLGPRHERLRNEHQSRHEARRSVVDAGGRHATPGPCRASWLARRFPSMNTYAKLGVAAAVVVVAALLGFNYLIAPNVGGPGLGSDPTPTPTPTPTATPDGLLPEGSH